MKANTPKGDSFAPTLVPTYMPSDTPRARMIEYKSISFLRSENAVRKSVFHSKSFVESFFIRIHMQKMDKICNIASIYAIF